MSAVWAKHGGAWEKVYPVTVLDAPVLTAMTTETSITYMWTAVDGATDYKFEFDGGVPEATGNVLTITKTGLTTGQTYTAKVRAKNADNVKGPWSNLLTVAAEASYNEATGGTVTEFDEVV